jgi:putative transcriptional regulator
MDIEKTAQAIEADAGMELPSLRQSLADAKGIMSGLYVSQARVHTPEQILARLARAKTGLSQPAFADLIKTPVATLRDWEQGRFPPPGGVVCLLKIINNHPELTAELDGLTIL